MKKIDIIRGNPLLVMSLAGSTVLLLYGIICFTLKRHISLRCRYFILKLAVFFFLVPLFRFKYRILDLAEKVISFPKKDLGQTLDPNSIVIMSEQHTYVGMRIQLLWLCMLCMAIIFLSLMTRSLLRYKRAKKLLMSCRKEPAPSKLQSWLDQVKKERNISAEALLVCSRECDIPMTIGILKPTIIFPITWEEDFGDQSSWLMLQHELIHIQHRDLIMELLGQLVIALHWFNPLSYILYHELSVMRELCCDRSLVGERDEELRKEYSSLLIDVAAQKVKKEEWLTVSFLGRNKRVLRRRILEMKEKRKQKTCLAVFASAVVFLTGSLTALAYVPPQTIELPDYDPSIKGEQLFEESELKIEAILYDSFWVNLDGTIEEVTDSELEVQTSCNHIYKNGIYTKHVKNNSGGCTITYQEAKKCTKCGLIKVGDVINVVTYQKCMH